MPTVNHPVVNALVYLVNTGESVTAIQFDQDHEPIGPHLRDALTENDLVYTDRAGLLKLTELGRRGLRALAEQERLKGR